MPPLIEHLPEAVQDGLRVKRGGQEWNAPCPRCGGDDRFTIWPEQGDSGRFWCRRCQWSGDGIELAQECAGLSFPEACLALGMQEKLGGGQQGDQPLLLEHITNPSARRRAAASDRRGPDATQVERPSTTSVASPATLLRPPGEYWQERARAFVEECRRSLWNDTSDAKATRRYLYSRGFSEWTMRNAGLGLNRRTRRPSRASWGLTPEGSKKAGNSLWIPRGVVIPWEVEGDFWKLNIRRAPEDVKASGGPKYIQVAGKRKTPGDAPNWSTNALYGADELRTDRPAVLVEGELDALAIRQKVGHLTIAVATGSAQGAFRERWVAKLTACRKVLLAFDADEAGEQAARKWAGLLPDTARLRPLDGGDPGEMLEDGRDFQRWVREGLGHRIDSEEPEDLKSIRLFSGDPRLDDDEFVPCLGIERQIPK